MGYSQRYSSDLVPFFTNVYWSPKQTISFLKELAFTDPTICPVHTFALVREWEKEEREHVRGRENTRGRKRKREREQERERGLSCILKGQGSDKSSPSALRLSGERPRSAACCLFPSLIPFPATLHERKNRVECSSDSKRGNWRGWWGARVLKVSL